VLATERDHIIPIADGGTEHPDNTQGLCSQCNAEKNSRQRGR
jgi:5-methylcytosine-specific restriction endonuclease McrA